MCSNRERVLNTSNNPLDEEDYLSEDQTKLDDVELPKLETQVPILC